MAGMRRRGRSPLATTGANRGHCAASIGLLLHLATALLYGPSGLVAPDAGVAVLYAAWSLILALGLSWRRRHPRRVLALPGVSVVFWISVVTFGDARLGWTG